MPTYGTTTKRALRYLLGSNKVKDIDAGFQSLAEDVDNLLLPAGSILATGRATAPTGFLLCDGAAVSRTTYAGLFTAIATAYGVGNGTTTFNLPDLRGRVPGGCRRSSSETDRERRARQYRWC